MDYKILIIRNRVKYDLSDDIQKFLGWMERNTPFKVLLTFVDSDLPLKWKDYKFLPPGATQSAWGLDGIKEQLLDSSLPTNNYNSIFFVYEQAEAPQPGVTRAWAYPNLLNGAGFAEIPIQQGLLPLDFLYQLLSHEIIHQWHRNLWGKGVVTRDDMDLTKVPVACTPNHLVEGDGKCYDFIPYYKDYEMDAPDGNRALNLARIKPYWTLLVRSSVLDALSYLRGLVAKLLAPVSKLDLWAKAVQDYEGYFPPSLAHPFGTPAYKNCNPGNLRFTDYTKSLGAYKASPAGFAIFPSYESGFNALKQFLTDAATANDGKLSAYEGANLIKFCQLYAPSADGNEPLGYANFLAKRLKVVPQTLISELI